MNKTFAHIDNGIRGVLVLAVVPDAKPDEVLERYRKILQAAKMGEFMGLLAADAEIKQKSFDE